MVENVKFEGRLIQIQFMAVEGFLNSKNVHCMSAMFCSTLPVQVKSPSLFTTLSVYFNQSRQ